jgi:hypothetical protein
MGAVNYTHPPSYDRGTLPLVGLLEWRGS